MKQKAFALRSARCPSPYPSFYPADVREKAHHLTRTPHGMCMRCSIHGALAIHTLVGHLSHTNLECAQKVDPLAKRCVWKVCISLFRLLCFTCRPAQRPHRRTPGNFQLLLLLWDL